jgi:hypothetical protein
LEEEMNKTIKIILVILGSLVALCLCIVVVGLLAFRSTGRILQQTIDNDPVEVAAISDDIADFPLPAGFREGQAVRLANFSMVTYTAVNGRTHIYLMQAPRALVLDKNELERQMSVASGTDQWTEVTVIETQSCQIRGEEATLVISEGVSHNGQRYRSANAVFDGNEGTALVNISGPVTEWDQEMVDSFIASLH